MAWSYSREPDEIEIVTSWDAELHHCSDVEKAPTQIYYDEKGQCVKWGYSIPPEKEPLKWFKLLLLDPKDLPAEVARSTQLQEARRLRNKSNKEPIEIIADFLRKLWDHSLESIKRGLGADLVQRTKLHVVITLPAIWPPYAQRRMKQAAQQSGILDVRSAGATTLRFITEPEAAALATIKDLSKRSNIKVRKGFGFRKRLKGQTDICRLATPSLSAMQEAALSYVYLQVTFTLLTLCRTLSVMCLSLLALWSSRNVSKAMVRYEIGMFSDRISS